MRKAERIKGALAAIEYYWQKHPDLRLGQLIVNAISENRLYYEEDTALIVSIAFTYEDFYAEGFSMEDFAKRLTEWTGKRHEVDPSSPLGVRRED